MPGRWERERGGKRWREARWELRDGAYVLVEGDWDEAPLYPTAAPPALREEKWEPRRGFVWVKGRWDWRNGEWAWVDGHMERERAKQRWLEGRWELRGDHYVWVEGSWGAPPEFPPLDQRPPEPRFEPPPANILPGHQFYPGHWTWVDGQYVWKPGTVQKLWPGQTCIPGKWGQREGHWYWIDGGCKKDEAPPPPP